MAISTLLNPAAWQRRGFHANWWTWKTIFAYKREGPHINVLELDAIVVAVKWRMRKASNIGEQFVHLSDSQVSISVAAKCRSSVKALQKGLNRLCTLVLASCSFPFWVFIGTADNPADEPSRRL